MQGERTREDVNCQGNAGECRGMYCSGCKVPEECRGMHGNAGECQGNARQTYGNECKVPGEYR